MLEEMSSSPGRVCLAVFCLLCLPAGILRPQADYGSIVGPVTDSTGAGYSTNGPVTVTDEAKRTVVTVQSGAAGDFSAEHLIPDTYDIKVATRGLRPIRPRASFTIYATFAEGRCEADGWWLGHDRRGDARHDPGAEDDRAICSTGYLQPGRGEPAHPGQRLHQPGATVASRAQTSLARRMTGR